MGGVNGPWDDIDPSRGTRSYLRWAVEMGATTLGEAADLLEQFELGNDVPEILGEDDTVDAVRAEIEEGLESAGADQELTALM